MYPQVNPALAPLNTFNNPYLNMYQQSQNQPMYSQPTMTLTRVTGLEGARAYQMSPNSTVALFDNNDDLMYIKTTDGAGFPTIRTFSFNEVSQTNTQVPANSDYVTRAEFEKLKEELLNGKQFIQQSTADLDTTRSEQHTKSSGSTEKLL